MVWNTFYDELSGSAKCKVGLVSGPRNRSVLQDLSEKDKEYA